jgi:hypothetical protein
MSYITDGESHLSGGRSSSMNYDVSQQIYDNFYRFGNRCRDEGRKLLIEAAIKKRPLHRGRFFDIFNKILFFRSTGINPFNDLREFLRC